MKHILTLIAGMLLVPLAWLRAADAPKPNVGYIMADDLGWGDISAHGGGVPTPNIDRLFSRGVERTQSMGWCVCLPTRAMLLTGRHPLRVGTAPDVGGELDPVETTIVAGRRTRITHPIYGWNEHDEGGWLLPTPGTDGKPDEARIHALGKILRLR